MRQTEGNDMARLERIDVKYFKLAVGLERLGRETDNDIAARCPICGDSRNNKHTKRLHLYKKGEVTNVNCFNGDCSAQNKTVYGFLNDFFPNLLNSYKNERFQENMSQLTSGDSDVFNEILGIQPEVETAEKLNDDWIKSDIVKSPEKTKKIVIPLDLRRYITKIEDVPSALEYIKNRGIDYDPKLFGSWFYGHQNLQIGETLYKVSDCIIIPLYNDITDESSMYGFYARSIKNKDFYTFMQDINIGYKVWNLFNIDTEKEVYIFEGIFDAIASGKKNIIAMMGAKIPEERLKELKKPIFVLDNDRTGLKNSLEYADLGYSVYVQPGNYKEKDMNELMLNNPELDISTIINKNILNGIMARVKISSLL